MSEDGNGRQAKERLKPISLHPHKIEDVLRAFMKVKPEKKKDKKERPQAG